MSSYNQSRRTEISRMNVTDKTIHAQPARSKAQKQDLSTEDDMIDINRVMMESIPRLQASLPPPRVARRAHQNKPVPERPGYAKEDWHKKSPKDVERFARYVNNRNKKRRKKSRRQLKPEDGDENAFPEEQHSEWEERYPWYRFGNPNFKREAGDPNFMYKFACTICAAIRCMFLNTMVVMVKFGRVRNETPTCRDRYHAPVFAVSKVVSQQMEKKVKEHSDLLPAAAAIISYMTAVSYSKSKEEIMRITLAVLGQHYSNIACIDFSKILPPMEDVSPDRGSCRDRPVDMPIFEPESEFSFRDLVRKLQDGTIALSETPIAKFLVGVFTLLSIAGCNGESIIGAGSAEMIDKVLKEVFPSHFRLSLVDSIFGILEFVATAVDHVRCGTPLSGFIFSDHLYRDICELLQEGADVQTGAIHKMGDEHVAAFKERVRDTILKVDSITSREGKKGKSVAMFITYGIRLRTILEDILTFERNATHRLRPVAIVLVGGSSIGKSNMYGHIRGVVGNAFGKQYPDANIAHLAADAKYDDVIKETTQVIQIDDIAALDDKNKDPSETALGKLLKMVNNEPVPTNQSVAERKDKIYFNPQLVIGSSNIYDLGILDAYKHPKAAFNRLEIIEVRLKPEFSLDGKLDEDLAEASVVDGIPAVMHDVRFIKWVENTVVRTPGKSAPRQMAMAEDMPWMSFDEYLVGLGTRAKTHVRRQKALREHALGISAKPRCDQCGNWSNSHWCRCVLSPEFGEAFGVVHEEVQDLFLNVYMSCMSFPLVNVVSTFGITILRLFQEYLIMLVPLLVSFVFLDYRILFHTIVCALACYHFGWLSAATVYLLFISFAFCIFSVVLAIGRYYFQEVEQQAVEAVARVRLAGDRILTMPYKRVAGCLVGLIGARLLIKNLMLLWRVKAEHEPQGNLMVTTPQTVEERRVEKSEWDRVNRRPVDLDHRLRTSTMDHILDKINTNLFRVEYNYSLDRKKVGFATFLEDNVVVINKHVWRSFENTNPLLTFSRGCSSSQFETYIERYFEDPEDDICYLVVANKPSTCSMSHLLYDGRYSGLASLARRGDDGAMQHDEIMLTPGRIASGVYVGILPERGVHYTPKRPTSKGDCGLLIVSVNKPHAIVGIHCAGNGVNGAATYFNVQSYKRFRQFLVEATIAPEGEYLLPICGEGDVLETKPYDEIGVVVSDDVDPRHCVNFYNCAAMNVGVCGYSDKARIKGRSDIRYNSAAPILEEHGVPLVYGPPRMLADRDHSKALENRSTPMKQIYPPLLSAALKDYLIPLLEKARDRTFRFFNKPLSLHEALNGLKETRFVNQVDETTACGFGVTGKKSKLLDVEYDFDTGEKILHAGPMLEARYQKIIEDARKGLRSNPLIKTALKSEPVKYENGAPKKNTRLFFVYPFAEFLATKAFFAPVVEFLLSLPFLSGCMGGINVNKKDWGDAYRYLSEYGTSRCIEGDYSSWDLRLSGQMIRASGCVLIHIARELGYAKEDLQAMVVMISDLASNYVMFQGALLNVDGIMISGTYLTLILNSISNALIHTCAFYNKVFEGTFTAPKGLSFRDHVRCIFMGDDSLCTSRTDAFSQLDMFAFCEAHGLQYTCGDKTAVMLPFKDLEDASFCKRGFRYCDELQEYLAPIALASIHKTLYMYKEESCITERNQIVDAMSAALYELARHPREVFEEQVEIIRKTAFELDLLHLVSHVNRSYDEWLHVLNVRYFQPESSLSDDELPISFTFEPEGAECAGVIPEAIPDSVLDTKKRQTNLFLRLALCCIGLFVLLNYPPNRISNKHRVSLFQEQKQPRSQIGNISVSDQTGAWVSGVKTGSDGTSIHAATSDTSDSFMTRPIRVGTYQWEVGQQLYAEFNPWRAFFEDSRVMNRIAHFRNLRAEMHVELLVNGNPFYYGRGIMSYIPLPDSDQISIFRSDRAEDLIEASQRPHIYFNPTTCEGGGLACPFVFPKSQLDIVRREWRKMGLVTLKSMNTLRHANGGVDPITITVLVHAKNLQLNTPTSVLPLNLTPQSGDEYGMVSKPAMVVARAAGVLSQIPQIRSFARATEMIATLSARTAMIFGYSRPAIVLENGMITRHFGSPCTVNSVDTSLSMSLDSKKEVTIDPAVCGLAGDDDMAFSAIVQRESFVDTFEWDENDASDRHLFSLRICPTNGLIDDENHAHITPATLVAMCFDYWTGSMEVRLQVVSSAYHRGRLRVVWDPEYVTDPGVYNVSYSSLIDITECTDITYKIGWGQEFDYLRVARLREFIPNQPRGTQPRDRSIFANGTLSVYVVNGLTSPSDDATVVDVNVFTKMCDDFQVASPSSYNMETLRLVRNPFRIPEDADLEFLSYGARFVIGSVGKEPSRVDEENSISNIQLLPDGPRRFRYFTYANYAGVQETDFVVRYLGVGNANLKLAWQDSNLDFNTSGAETTQTIKINVEPGWNYVDFEYFSNNAALDMISMEAGTPVRNERAILVGPEVVDRIDGSVLAFYADQPTVAFAQYEGPLTSRVLDLFDAVAGTQASVTLTRPSKVEGSVQVIEDLDLPPGAARVFTFTVPADKKITISKGVATPWIMEVVRVTYVRDLDYLAPQGGDEMISDGTAPESVSLEETMGSMVQPPNMNEIYFGELIGSFRPLLKRYLTSYFWDMPDGTTPASYVITALPQYPTTVVDYNAGGEAYTTAPNAFAIVASAFVCMRGSTRVKLLSNKAPTSTIAIKETWFASRLPVFRRGVYAFSRFFESGPSFTSARYKGYRLDGSVADNTLLKPGAEFEFPYYSQYKFTSPRTSTDYRPADYIVESQYLIEPCYPAFNSWITVNYSAGEDFSLAFFLSTPELRFL